MQDHSASEAETGWRALYLAALFEADRDKLEERIIKAEMALVQRGRELFHAAGGHTRELRAIDAAMGALRALRNSYQFRGSAGKGKPDAA